MTENQPNAPDFSGLAHTIIAVFAIVGLLVLQSHSVLFRYAAFLVPLLHIVIDFQHGHHEAASSRGYYLYFFVSIFSLHLHAFEIGGQIQDLGAAKMEQILALMVPQVPHIISAVLVPQILGIATLVIASTAIRPTSNTTDHLLDRLATWLAESDAPAEIQQGVENLTHALTALQHQYAEVSNEAETSTAKLTALGIASDNATKEIQHLQREANQVSVELSSLREDASGTRVEMNQIGLQVGEFGDVLDQFADVACHEIMQHSPSYEERPKPR